MKHRLTLPPPLIIETDVGSFRIILVSLSFGQTEAYFLGAEDLNPLVWMRKNRVLSEPLGKTEEEAKKTLETGFEFPPVTGDQIAINEAILAFLREDGWLLSSG